MVTNDLRNETLVLARKFKAEADRLDTLFVQRTDPRAVQGGALCEEANCKREASRKLFQLARQMDE